MLQICGIKGNMIYIVQLRKGLSMEAWRITQKKIFPSLLEPTKLKLETLSTYFEKGTIHILRKHLYGRIGHTEDCT